MLTEMDISSLLEKVHKPTRYLGQEINAVYKKKEEVKVHLVLAFPDLYEVGMSHLGLKILYALVNERPGFYAERVFAPDKDMEELLKKEKIPLFSLESRTPLGSFDLVGFTLQYELSYTTVLNMLELGGIPLHSDKRKEGDPFIVGGGPGALNPEPLAPFFDFFVIGDGEEILPELLQEFAYWKAAPNRGDRKDFLQKIVRIPGIYVPSFYGPLYDNRGKFCGIKPLTKEAPLEIERRTVYDLESAFYPDTFVVPYMNVIHDRAVLELFRGCSKGCRFCQAGYIYRPVRERTVSRLKELAENIIGSTGYEELSLSSLSSSDYSCIEELLDELEKNFAEKHVKLSLPSLRADVFALRLADRVSKSGGVTFAPEAGSQRLRNVINKKISEEAILEVVEQAVSSGRNHIKLYFMIGLPTETEQDLKELVKLVQKIAVLRQTGSRKRSFRVTVSASTFVPKAHTPFQWEPQITLQEIKIRQEFLREHLRKLKGVDFKWHEAEMSFLEAVFARGDRRLAPVLERAYSLGCRLDAWSESFNFSLWQKAFALEGIEPQKYAQYKPALDDPLPWEHIKTGLSREFLQKEYQKALKGEVTCDCREAGCVGCGLEKCPLREVNKGASL